LAARPLGVFVATKTSSSSAASSVATAGESLELPVGVPALDHRVATRDITEVAQPREERRSQVGVTGLVQSKPAYARDLALARLLGLAATVLKSQTRARVALKTSLSAPHLRSERSNPVLAVLSDRTRVTGELGASPRCDRHAGQHPARSTRAGSSPRAPSARWHPPASRLLGASRILEDLLFCATCRHRSLGCCRGA
jgi:hypothetical protein